MSTKESTATAQNTAVSLSAKAKYHAETKLNLKVDDSVVYHLPGSQAEKMFRIADIEFAPNGMLKFTSYPSKFSKDSSGRPKVQMCLENQVVRTITRSTDDEKLWVPNRKPEADAA